MAIKRLQNKYFRGWDADKEHIVSFKVRLNREQKAYSESALAVTITDKEKAQHCLEEVLKHPERWDKKCVTEWDEKREPDKAWPAPLNHFEARQKKLETYEMLGGKQNKYATINATTDTTSSVQDAVTAVGRSK